MRFEHLKKLVEDYYSAPSLSSVIFGCDCGCGGDWYNYEDWEYYENASEAAKKELQDFGVEFDE